MLALPVQSNIFWPMVLLIGGSMSVTATACSARLAVMGISCFVVQVSRLTHSAMVMVVMATMLVCVMVTPAAGWRLHCTVIVVTTRVVAGFQSGFW